MYLLMYVVFILSIKAELELENFKILCIKSFAW